MTITKTAMAAIKTIRALAVGAAASLCALSAAQAGVVVGSTTDLSDLAVGQVFEVVVATDDAQAEFDGFQFDLTYDADVVGYEGATFNEIFFLEAGQSEPDAASGIITVQNITAGLFQESVSGAITLVTLRFVVREEGMTEIALSPTAGVFLSLLGQEVAGGGTFTLDAIVPMDDVAPIPVPAAALLFAPVLLAGRFLSRRVA